MKLLKLVWYKVFLYTTIVNTTASDFSQSGQHLRTVTGRKKNVKQYGKEGDHFRWILLRRYRLCQKASGRIYNFRLYKSWRGWYACNSTIPSSINGPSAENYEIFQKAPSDGLWSYVPFIHLLLYDSIIQPAVSNDEATLEHKLRAWLLMK